MKTLPLIGLYPPLTFEEYQLIDSGDQEKLERFGSLVLCRPEPQAIWKKQLSTGEWDRQAQASFRRLREARQGSFEGERGEWKKKPSVPEQWTVTHRGTSVSFRMRLGFTAFGHIGIFPEQAPNWEYIANRVSQIKQPAKVLNLFAYTGAASLAAARAGAEVWHVDSVKPVISWAKENADMNGIDNIHWVLEDAMKFVRREVKRGNRYHGIILDPPAYGRGPDGEKWILEDQVGEMMDACHSILHDSPGSFILLNLYSLGHSSLIARNLFREDFFRDETIETGELVIPSADNKFLPLGIFARGHR
ncbi:MAG: class I SAM-dependent methyltransferase [Bacteroidales bacterium]